MNTEKLNENKIIAISRLTQFEFLEISRYNYKISGDDFKYNLKIIQDLNNYGPEFLQEKHFRGSDVNDIKYFEKVVKEVLEIENWPSTIIDMEEIFGKRKVYKLFKKWLLVCKKENYRSGVYEYWEEIWKKDLKKFLGFTPKKESYSYVLLDTILDEVANIGHGMNEFYTLKDFRISEKGYTDEKYGDK